MRFTTFGALIALASCTTFSDIEGGLTNLEGRNIQAAFNALGYPDANSRIGLDTVYFWGNRQSFSIPVTTPSTTYGTVGTTSFSATTYNTTYQQMNYQCDIKIVASSSGIIKTWEYYGNVGGCSRYAARLKSLKSTKKKVQPARTTIQRPTEDAKSEQTNGTPLHH